MAEVSVELRLRKEGDAAPGGAGMAVKGACLCWWVPGLRACPTHEPQGKRGQEALLRAMAAARKPR